MRIRGVWPCDNPPTDLFKNGGNARGDDRGHVKKIFRQVSEIHTEFSFELFPPKSEIGEKNLLSQIHLVERIKTRAICVTSGAGGSGNDRTLKTIKSLENNVSSNLTAHLTCIAATKNQTHQSLDRYAQEGIFNIVALRGDLNEDQNDLTTLDSYGNAANLVRGIRNRNDGDQFHISVAGYPETHPKAKSRKSDLENLKEKVDAGADLILTQFFFDPVTFLQFIEDTDRVGINVPIIPGLIIPSNFHRVFKFAEKCGTHIPDSLIKKFDGVESGSETANRIAAEITLQQCSHLSENGIRSFHFYTLNRLDLVVPVCELLQEGISSSPKPVHRKP